MKVLRTTLVPDESVPEFKRLRFEVADKPLREVLLNGLHPLGLARGFSCDRDGSSLAEVFADRLNGEDNILPGLKEFGHSHEVKPPTRQYRYGYEHRESGKDDALVSLEHVAGELYFVDALPYSQLVEIARRRLARDWRHALAKELLCRKLYAFNDQRRFLKARSKRVRLKSREELDHYDLAEVLGIEDFKSDDKLLVDHGIPGTVNFRRCRAVQDFTTQDGFLSLYPRIGHFEMRVYDLVEGQPVRCGGHVQYSCTLQDGRIRFVPELKLTSDRRCRERARAVAGQVAPGRGRYCFTLKIEQAEKLLDRAEIRFPYLDYSKPRGGEPSGSSAGLRSDVAVRTYAVGPVATEQLTNGSLARLLREYDEKVSGIKEELAGRMAELLARLYKESEAVLTDFFKPGFVRLNGVHGPHPEVFEPPIRDGGLRHSVVALYVLKHLRGSRILSPEWENTGYSVEDLAKALIERRVAVEGVFVKTERGAEACQNRNATCPSSASAVIR